MHQKSLSVRVTEIKFLHSKKNQYKTVTEVVVQGTVQIGPRSYTSNRVVVNCM